MTAPHREYLLHDSSFSDWQKFGGCSIQRFWDVYKDVHSEDVFEGTVRME